MSGMWTVKVVGLGVVALSLSVELLGWLIHRLRPKRARTEVLFFPSEMACLEHIFAPSSPQSCCCPLPHGVETSFSRLVRCILSASSSLDVCVFAFSNIDLCKAVLTLRCRGVTIRVLCDKDYAAIHGSQIGVLRRAGKRNRSIYFLNHHKFALVDNRLLITGSLNWTMTAVQSNKENVIVTEDPDLVLPFLKEFQRLWLHSDPAQYLHLSDPKPAEKPTTPSTDKP
ncbi:hypothetical protein F7725_005601 [Dissostichus mawsoni]|uniref:Mitochondrial cardiolipin hydrolase n=1 Tax=Dissostichus mawsoni TaxID=36200 RepID=A0A7J5YRW5_DISMA|nr:hypothetical protein F7725_005601 [Dissostichus mawsoni]